MLDALAREAKESKSVVMRRALYEYVRRNLGKRRAA